MSPLDLARPWKLVGAIAFLFLFVQNRPFTHRNLVAKKRFAPNWRMGTHLEGDSVDCIIKDLADCSLLFRSGSRVAQNLNNKKWRTLVTRIGRGQCTPFLGAGVNDQTILPLGGTIAETWADENQYPLEDRYDLARVAQYLAITGLDPMDCKDDLCERWFTNVPLPDFNDAKNPLGLLADLPLPLYITTNYDSLLYKALRLKGRDPIREFCRWNDHPQILSRKSVWEGNAGYRPIKDAPVVYHLHGIDEVRPSLVLTEDDYIDFLVRISQPANKLLPAFIQEAMAGTSLVFIGYRMADWTFRVLFRGLVNASPKGLQRVSMAVQLPPGKNAEEQERIQNYLDAYYGSMQTLVFWGTAEEFTEKLRKSCEDEGIIPSRGPA